MLKSNGWLFCIVPTALTGCFAKVVEEADTGSFDKLRINSLFRDAEWFDN
jgi:hypothetical protein